jgi:hypothetical protein
MYRFFIKTDSIRRAFKPFGAGWDVYWYSQIINWINLDYKLRIIPSIARFRYIREDYFPPKLNVFIVVFVFEWEKIFISFDFNVIFAVGFVQSDISFSYWRYPSIIFFLIMKEGSCNFHYYISLSLHASTDILRLLRSSLLDLLKMGGWWLS